MENEAERRKALAMQVKERKSERKVIVDALKQQKGLTVKALSEQTGLSTHAVLSHIIALRKAGLVAELPEEENSYFRYALQSENVDIKML